MNKISFFLLLIISGAANAQQLKPVFKSLQFATYTTLWKGNKQSIVITGLLEFDQKGQVYHVSNFYLDGFYSDTTFQASDDLIGRLNNVFNGKTTLESYRITDKMPRELDGPLLFISYDIGNGKNDNIAFVEGFVRRDLGDLMHSLRRIPLPKIKHTGKVYHNRALEAKILKYHLVCKYIPKSLREPPTVNQLEIADPSVKH